jgi:hypothetical protein
MAKQLQEAGAQFTVKDSDLLQDGDKDTTYTLRHLTREKHREIQAEHTEKVINKRTHQREDRTDWAAVTDALVDYVIVGWAGVLYRGQPAPCDREHKMLLDAPTTDAILERAGLNAITGARDEEAEIREASFRQPGDVPHVLGG